MAIKYKRLFLIEIYLKIWNVTNMKFKLELTKNMECNNYNDTTI